MPKAEHLVLCGGAQPPRRSGGESPSLNLHGPSPNVFLKISDISRKLLANIPNRLLDLLEIASYVYAADSALSRGGRTDSQMGAHWRRNFRFRIPVREPDFWASRAVTMALVEALSFLSDDQYTFEFLPFENAPDSMGYFELSSSEESAFSPDEVILFSGGLDSFAGAVEELLGRGLKVALVSHRSSSKIANAQRNLIEELRRRAKPGSLLHIPVLVHLDGDINNEQTHRTRSFLFAALAAVVTSLFKLNRIRFYENGIVSLNLPPVSQVVGARATRTTHPQTLAGFRKVLTAVLNDAVDITNPYTWLTKAEVIKIISSHGCADLIPHTRSCTRVREMTVLHPHCGRCSQCIDRRFAVLASGLGEYDPAEAYNVDLFTGERPPQPDREMALSYVRTASDIDQMEDVTFFSRFGEANRVVRNFDEPVDIVAARILDLYRRHAKDVCSVVEQAIANHAPDLRQGTLSPDSLLRLLINQHDPSILCAERDQETYQALTKGQAIRIAADAKRNAVVFDRWGEIKGAGAKLLMALMVPFNKAAANGNALEQYPFTKSGVLTQQLEIQNEETLRLRVLRLRKKIQELAREAGDLEPQLDAVIENYQWHGYRLNPESVRVLTLEDLRPV